MLDSLIAGTLVVFSLQGLLAVILGTLAGIVIGALPGLGPSIGVALLIPFTYNLEPAIGLILLVALYQAAEYGGSITAILINTPGTAGATATLIDGYPLARQGKAGLALGVSLSGSTVGGFVGIAALILLTHPLSVLAVKIGPPAYFSLGILGLTIVASLSEGSTVKGLITATLGLGIAMVGIDPITGMPRMTFGAIELYEGIPYLTALIGLFAFSEVFALAERAAANIKADTSVRHVFLSNRQFIDLLPAMMRGSVIGTIIGIVPGVGASIAAWISYDVEKRVSKTPQEFGKGALAGVAGPEAANNAVVGSGLIPMLALGIPGSATSAIIMGALILHGLQPGPQLFADEPVLVYALFVGLSVATVAMYLLGSFALPLWIRMIAMPTAILAPIIFGLGAVGSYSLRNLVFDMWIALAFGLLGYILKKYRFPLAPLVLAMVLGYLIESNFRQSLLLSRGSYLIFLRDPYSAVALAIAAMSFLWPMYQSFRTRRRLPAE